MPLDSLQFELSDKEKKSEPGPGEKPRAKRGRPRGSTTGVRVETQLRDELGAFLKFGALMWSTKDPTCASVLNEQSELIAADLAKMAGRSKWARKWIEQTAQLGELIPFLMHIAPVIQVINSHHIAPAIERRNNVATEEPEDSQSDNERYWPVNG